MRETISHSWGKFPFDNISTSDTACLTSLSPVAVVKAGEPFNATGQTDKMASLKIQLLDKAPCKVNTVKVMDLENVVVELLEMQTNKYCLSE